jgi:hypothetical protein
MITVGLNFFHLRAGQEHTASREIGNHCVEEDSDQQAGIHTLQRGNDTASP